MRRHERPRLSNTREDVPVNSNWCELSLAQRRTHIFTQLKSLGPSVKQPKMKCLCGKIVPIMFAYRCYECGAFWCPKCARKHFTGANRSGYLEKE